VLVSTGIGARVARLRCPILRAGKKIVTILQDEYKRKTTCLSLLLLILRHHLLKNLCLLSLIRMITNAAKGRGVKKDTKALAVNGHKE